MEDSEKKRRTSHAAYLPKEVLDQLKNGWMWLLHSVSPAVSLKY